MGFYDDLEISNPEGENLETDANYHGPATEVLTVVSYQHSPQLPPIQTVYSPVASLCCNCAVSLCHSADVHNAGCSHLPHAALLQKRQEAFTSYKDYIGMDITSLVTLPVWIMEPFTILQRLAEIMEYTEQLDRAAGTEDQYER